MRYQFIKIEETTEGSIAYMLDTERGVVVIAPVEYLGEAPVVRRKPKPMIRYIEEDEEVLPVAPIRRVRREVIEEEEIPEETLPVLRGPMAPDPHGGVDADGLKDIGRSKPSKAQSIMPPHLRGITKKDADFEKREILG